MNNDYIWDLFSYEVGKTPSTVNFEDFRGYVDSLPTNRDTVPIKTLYLTASRVCEVITKTIPSDSARGLRSYGELMDYTIVDYVDRKVEDKVLLLTIEFWFQKH